MSKKFNVAIFAGYDVLADKSEEHKQYIQASFYQAERSKINLILLIGGRTNPDYPRLSEAGANKKILETMYAERGMFGMSNWPRIDVLPVGHTAAEGLEAVKRYFEAEKRKMSIKKLLICAEKSRLPAFMVDALYVGVLDFADNIVTYGHPFSESKDNFKKERKKMLIKVMSHYSKLVRKFRNVSQKIHQKKVVKRKKEDTEKIKN